MFFTDKLFPSIGVGRCPYVPSALKSRVSTMKDSHASNRGGRKQYWIDSAKRIGLVDTSFGIHYGRDPKEPLPPLVSEEGAGELSRRTTSEMEEDNDELDLENSNEWERSMSYGDDPLDDGEIGSNVVDDVAAYPLVTPEEKHLVTDYLYLALEQMQPCKLQDADRVGCYKGRRTGFPGLACKHCIGRKSSVHSVLSCHHVSFDEILRIFYINEQIHYRSRMWKILSCKRG
jgi:hypothetical protein